MVVEDVLAFPALHFFCFALESSEHHLLVAGRWTASNSLEKCCEGWESVWPASPVRPQSGVTFTDIANDGGVDCIADYFVENGNLL